MMGLYQLKEFLTLDDVADYLRDKGVYDFDLSQSIDSYRIHDLLKEWAFSNKLSLVFSYYGRIDVYNKTFNEDARKPIEKINPFTRNQNVVLVFNDCLLNQWANGQHLRHKFFDENVHKDTWQVPVYELFEYNYSLLDDKDHPFIILLDDCNGEYGIEPLFPKSQLDKILNAKDDSQQQIADLQAENARLQAHIAELESQNAINDNKLSYRTENTVGTIIAGLANIAKIDLTQPYSDDSNKRIRKELLRLGFKPNDKDGLPLSSDTVAKWLKIADKLSK